MRSTITCDHKHTYSVLPVVHLPAYRYCESTIHPQSRSSIESLPVTPSHIAGTPVDATLLSSLCNKLRSSCDCSLQQPKFLQASMMLFIPNHTHLEINPPTTQDVRSSWAHLWCDSRVLPGTVVMQDSYRWFQLQAGTWYQVPCQMSEDSQR